MTDDAPLAAWLRRLEALGQARIELGLDRVHAVLDRLPVQPPPGRVFTVAGTNGKGSTVGLLATLLEAGGFRVGRYTSPHLRRYTERMHVAGRELGPDAVVAAFETVATAAGSVPLTYFEFGTLAAFTAFSKAGCDTWVLEVGLGGRLDAVNALDPDWSLITTIGLDHQEYLGDTLEAIAGEKAGILRPGRPAFYGDAPVPRAIADRAHELGATLVRAGKEFGLTPEATGGYRFWSPWAGLATVPAIPGWQDAQYRNAALALAAVAASGTPLPPAGSLPDLWLRGMPPGRFTRVLRAGREWVVDVAHNPQAAAVLAAQLASLEPANTTLVVALLADKSVPDFVAALAPGVQRWIAAGLEGDRAVAGPVLAARLAASGAEGVTAAASPAAAFAMAEETTRAGGRIVVCGSFRLAGPALDWLGIY